MRASLAIFCASLELLLVCVSTATGQIPASEAKDKRLLFPDGISSHVDPGLLANLKLTQGTWDQWGQGWIPEACANKARESGVGLYNVDVFNVHYEDCEKAWVFCRGYNSQLSLADMINLFGRIPVHQREVIRHMVVMPGEQALSLEDGILDMKGDASPWLVQMPVFRAVDRSRRNTTRPYSTTDKFKNAISGDACVPDSLSQNNLQLDFATVAVLALYEAVVPGGLDSLTNGPDWRCLEKQKNAVNELIGGYMTLSGKCDLKNRLPDSPTIPGSV